MDDKAAYLDLCERMEKLLAFINHGTARPIGACFANGTCTMTTRADCDGTWHEGVECDIPDDDDDYARASQNLLDRMGRLLDSVHSTFEVGGKTYSVQMILREHVAAQSA